MVISLSRYSRYGFESVVILVLSRSRSPSRYSGLTVALTALRSAAEQVGRSALLGCVATFQSYYYFSPSVSIFQSPDSLRDLTQPATPVDHQRYLSGLHELVHHGQVLFAPSAHKHDRVLTHEPSQHKRCDRNGPKDRSSIATNTCTKRKRRHSSHIFTAKSRVVGNPEAMSTSGEPIVLP
jgi:hypothetical protein